MKRRTFLQHLLATWPLAIGTVPLVQSSCNKNQNAASNYRVIVIGAGISGLAAANKLKEAGFQVNILEAQNKAGGRLKTNRSSGIAFDEGASWIHGIQGNPITPLAQQAGMTTIHTDDDDFISYDVGGIAHNTSDYEQAETELYTILDTLMQQGSKSKSFEAVFNALHPAKVNDRLWKFLLSAYVTFDTGDLDRLSSLLYNEGEEFEGIETIATNGYDTLANYLAAGISIQFNQVVSQINYSAEKVQVTHSSGISEADFVLVTVPLGVLKAGSIQFIPSLPTNKTEAIQKVGMNCVNKFLLRWNTTFWDDVQYISYTPEIRDKFNYFVNVNKMQAGSHALMTFAYAEAARLTETMSDSQVVQEIMTHLKDIYGPGIPDPIALLRTQWQSNPNSFGSYSFTSVDTLMRHFDDLAEEVNDKLFFAGEHTEADYFSTVHGAYLSGLREASKIMALV